MSSLIKKPSAWVPMALSIIILVFILVTIAFSDPVAARQPDEGVAAHLFQLWLVAEFFMVGFFAITWLPQAPKQASLVLLIQIALIIAGCFPVFFFKL